MQFIKYSNAQIFKTILVMDNLVGGKLKQWLFCVL